MSRPFLTQKEMLDSLIKRLLRSRIIDSNKCWNWTGCLNNSGYGWIRYSRKTYGVHVIVAWLCLGYNLKSNLEICHSCDNHKCYNPLHLFFGTRKDNMRDALAKGRMIDRGGCVMGTTHTKAILNG